MTRPHDHNLRNSDMNLYILFPKTDYLKKCIGYNGAKLWNELPSRGVLEGRLGAKPPLLKF